MSGEEWEGVGKSGEGVRCDCGDSDGWMPCRKDGDGGLFWITDVPHSSLIASFFLAFSFAILQQDRLRNSRERERERERKRESERQKEIQRERERDRKKNLIDI